MTAKMFCENVTSLTKLRYSIVLRWQCYKEKSFTTWHQSLWV